MKSEEILHTVCEGQVIRVITSKAIPSNSPVLTLEGELKNSPDKYSYQLDENLHLDKSTGIQAEVRHSCNPNCAVDVERRMLVAIKDINAGDEITFDYASNEESLAAPFNCECNSPNCRRNIRGFVHLSENERMEIRRLASQYLAGKYF